MAREVMHIGKRSWWDGSVTTLCGWKLLDAERVWLSWLSGHTRCPGCQTAYDAGKRP